MKLFTMLYDKALLWAGHRYAPSYLAGLSFAESSFFPIPPDVMLAPMVLAQPKRAVFYATLTTITSVLGGVAGYFIGMFAFEFVEPLLRDYGYWERFVMVKQWFDQWGFWAIFIAGFSPIPYKLFTISAGVIAMPFLPFILASFIGRGARFYLVACLMAWGGQRMQIALRNYIDKIGWLVVIAAILAYFLIKY